MGRNVPQSFLDAMQAEVFEPLIFVEMEFDSGNLYMWNGIGDYTIHDALLTESGYTLLQESGSNILLEQTTSQIYTGVGNLLGVSEAEETSQVVSRGMTVTLSGVPSSLVSLALSEPFQGRSCVVRWGFNGSSSTSILFSGFIDAMEMDESAGTSIISVAVENELATLDRPVQRFYSDQSQKSRYPGDDFFSFVATLGDDLRNWGGE
jgi:hypothetical protein